MVAFVPKTARAGDFVVIRTRGWAGRFIRLGTRSPVNHAAVLMPDGRLIEARPNGAGWNNIATYTGCWRYWATTELTDEQRATICEWALQHVGTPYGWNDIAALGLSIEGIRWPWVRKRLRNPKTLICSQYVAEAYAEAGVTLCPGKEPDMVTPGDLLNYATTNDVPEAY